MVLPLLPLAAVAVAGIGGTLVGGWLGGGKKGEVHAEQEHYAPVKTYSPALTDQRSWITISESPGSSVDTKKTATTRTDTDVSTPRTETEGMDMTKIAIIGAVGIVAYGLVSK